MNDQIPLIDDGHREKLERDRAHEVDRTPPMVCRQGLTWAVHTIPDSGDSRLPRKVPRTVIDIGAGSGVFGQQLIELHAEDDWMFEEGPLHRIAIEPRVEELPHLRRHYERVHLGTFGAWLADSVEHFPIINAWVACNPPFSIFPEIVRRCVPVCEAVLLYGSIAWGCSEQGAELFDAHPPYACARVTGRVNHRGPGINPATITKECPEGKQWASDQRDNCWWLWLKNYHGDAWSTCNLPMLSSEQRRWTIPPGQEP